MPSQKLTQLKPDNFEVEVDLERGTPEPSGGTDTDKFKRLRYLLWSEQWQTKKYQLIAWNEADKSWYLWEKT